ncbi:MAG: STAS domain-containing protein [Spirochaetales bacterium]|nr:STAS domain-containing protein [Spirochaetales bacterium]
MDIPFKEKGDVLVFYFDESIEIFHTVDIRNFLVNTITEKNAAKVVFNFADVSFVDSMGIGLFINLQFKFKDTVSFRFCELHENIRKTFEFTNLLSTFEIDKTEEESIGVLAQKK